MHSIALDSGVLEYEIAQSVRARRIGLVVHPGGRVMVRLPKRIPETYAHTFVRKHFRWLVRARAKMLHRAPRTLLPRGKRDYAASKVRAIALCLARTAHFNQFYNFSFNRISIKNQSSRWGSCSRKGNLNFSYKLVHLPPELADYIVVHELCHLAHFNHSKDFWNLVAQQIPNHRALRKKLKAFSL